MEERDLHVLIAQEEAEDLNWIKKITGWTLINIILSAIRYLKWFLQCKQEGWKITILFTKEGERSHKVNFSEELPFVMKEDDNVLH